MAAAISVAREGVFINTRTTGWGSYQAILSTDDWEYGGQSRVSHEQVYHSADTDFGQGFQIYLPCRCCVVLRRVGD